MKNRLIKVGFITMIMFILSMGNVFADHQKSGYIDKVPKKPLTNLTPSQAEERDKLVAKVEAKYEEYIDKVLAEATKVMKKNDKYSVDCNKKTGKCKVDMTREVIMDAQKKYSNKYFGSWKTYEDKEVGKLAKTLFDKYGYIVHYGREQGNLASDYLCNADNSHKWDATKCEGAVKIGNFDNFYWNDNKKVIETSGKTWEITIKRAAGLGTDTSADVYTIASHGMFTTDQVKYYGACNIEKAKSEAEGEVGKPKVAANENGLVGSANEDTSKKLPFSFSELSDKVGQELRDTFKKFTMEVQGNLFAADCKGESLSVVSQFLNISRPLNLTDNQYIMKLVHITQQIAFTLTIVFIAFYALMYTTGYQNLDPVKFGIRLFISLLAVNYLPWLMQDILSLNNIIVYNLSQMNFAYGVGGNAGEILMGTFLALFDGYMDAGIGESILLLILGIIMAFVAIMPMLRIIMWWYIRLLHIFLAAVIGPIMMMMAALPQTADKAMKWIEQYIGEVFEQVFMVFGLLLVAMIIGNIGPMGEQMGLGWFGRAILIYASIFFLAEVPTFAKSFLSGFRGGEAKGMANNFAKSGKNSVRSVKKATKTTAKAGATGALGAVGIGAGMKAGITGKTSNGKLMQKVMSSKAGRAGFGTGKVGGKIGATPVRAGVNSTKNAASGFSAGYGGFGQSNGNGISGKVGSMAGAATGATQRGLVKAKMLGTNNNNGEMHSKMKDAKVTAGLATAMGAATVMNNFKKDNLKKKVNGKINESLKKPMSDMYQKSYGTDNKGRSQNVTTYTEKGFNDATKIAKNEGSKGGTNQQTRKNKKDPKK